VFQTFQAFLIEIHSVTVPFSGKTQKGDLFILRGESVLLLNTKWGQQLWQSRM